MLIFRRTLSGEDLRGGGKCPVTGRNAATVSQRVSVVINSGENFATTTASRLIPVPRENDEM